jgi:hypothetical protein
MLIAGGQNIFFTGDQLHHQLKASAVIYHLRKTIFTGE